IIKVGLSLAYFSLLIRFGAPLLDGKWDFSTERHLLRHIVRTIYIDPEQPSTVLLFNSKALSTDSSSMNVINAKMFFPHTTRILSIVPHLLNIASSLAGSTDSKCSRFIMLIERVAFCSMSFDDRLFIVINASIFGMHNTCISSIEPHLANILSSVAMSSVVNFLQFIMDMLFLGLKTYFDFSGLIVIVCPFRIDLSNFKALDAENGLLKKM
uniref:Uncharacterized protein n=1 Tax=Glossina palpalis gambiensis TaxID=67801 RepID=A0A1B0AV81_9MUSC